MRAYPQHRAWNCIIARASIFVTAIEHDQSRIGRDTLAGVHRPRSNAEEEEEEDEETKKNDYSSAM